MGRFTAPGGNVAREETAFTPEAAGDSEDFLVRDNPAAMTAAEGLFALALDSMSIFLCSAVPLAVMPFVFF